MDCPAPGHEELGAWINLLQARDAVAAAVERRLVAHVRLSLPEHDLLVRLSSAPSGTLRMADLAHLLLLSKSGVTRIVDRMVGEGWVRRELSDRDRRMVFAVLTPRGRVKVTESIPVYAEAVRDVFLRHLSEQDVRDLRRILRNLLEGCGVWTDARCSPDIARLFVRR